MSAKESTPMPDGVIRPRAPSAPPKKSTSSFLLAELHRAQHQGFKTLEISTIELSELLAKVESLEARAANEFNGKHLGYATGHKLKSMLSGARKYLTVSAYKTENFDTEVTIPEMSK